MALMSLECLVFGKREKYVWNISVYCNLQVLTSKTVMNMQYHGHHNRRNNSYIQYLISHVSKRISRKYLNGSATQCSRQKWTWLQ